MCDRPVGGKRRVVPVHDRNKRWVYRVRLAEPDSMMNASNSHPQYSCCTGSLTAPLGSRVYDHDQLWTAEHWP
eukprot:3932237-Rhodomonas_salina.3